MRDTDPFVQDNPPTIELGVMETDPAPLDIEGYDRAARYAEVHIVPGDRIHQCRVAVIGQGAGRGLFAYPEKGDEVLVFYPGGRDQSPVVLGGLGNLKAPHPSEAGTTKIVILHPGGVELRDTNAANVEKILLRPFAASGVNGHLTDVSTLAGAISTWAGAVQAAIAAIDPIEGSTLSPATAALTTAVGAFAAQVAAFKALIGTDGAPGTKYASDDMKASE